MPTFTLVAGPNGSGKSTLTAAITFEGSASVVDADAIARVLDPELRSQQPGMRYFAVERC